MYSMYNNKVLSVAGAAQEAIMKVSFDQRQWHLVAKPCNYALNALAIS